MNATHPKESGYWYATDLYGKVVDGATMSCCHCQRTWVKKKGSEKNRGWCPKCNQFVCGGLDCNECVPPERRCDNIEAGRPELTPSPAAILVPAAIEGIQ